MSAGPLPGANPAARSAVLQIGFGLDAEVLQPGPSCRGLDLILVAPDMPSADELRRAHRASALEGLADALAARWPPATRNLHRIALDDGRVRLLLAPGAAHDWLPELRASIDRFLLRTVDLSHDPQGGARRLAKALARLAAPGAQLQAAPGLEALRPALASAGFRFEGHGGSGLNGEFAPRFAPRGRPRPRPDAAERHVWIVGAGLAGCATACALAERGWRSTLLDRRDAPARDGSSNPAGLFHGIVNAQDGVHARFNRAAALQARIAVQQAIDGGHALGSAGGLLRLETSGKPVARMRDELAALRLPPDYVQALDAGEASTRGGLPLQHPAWFYPGGGWVEPAGLARSFLQRAGDAARLQAGVEVRTLRRVDGRWQLLDGAGRCIATAAHVVLANAQDALRLLGADDWPLQSVRGQISLAPANSLRLPSLPLAGSGYLLPAVGGLALFGASSQPGDDDAQPRAADHAFNLQRLQQLSPQPRAEALSLQGRVGWRCVADDRLPLVGRAPDEAALAGRRIERLIDMPRREGLHLFTGLASRGISWCALGSQLLAAQIDGGPLPLEASLVDALDPGRFALRRLRRGAAGG